MVFPLLISGVPQCAKKRWQGIKTKFSRGVQVYRVVQNGRLSGDKHFIFFIHLRRKPPHSNLKYPDLLSSKSRFKLNLGSAVSSEAKYFWFYLAKVVDSQLFISLRQLSRHHHGALTTFFCTWRHAGKFGT